MTTQTARRSVTKEQRDPRRSARTTTRVSARVSARVMPPGPAADPLAPFSANWPAIVKTPGAEGSARIVLARSYDEVQDLGRALVATAKPTASFARLRHALDTIYRVSNAVLAEDDLDRLFSTVMDSVMEALAPDRAFLALVDQSTGELRLAAEHTRITGTASATGGASAAGLGTNHAVPTDGPSLSLIRGCVDQSVAVITEDALVDPRFAGHSSVKVLGIRSAVCVPLRSATRRLGAIYCDRLASRQVFASHELDLLAAVGRQAGLAVERAHVYADMETLFFSCVRALVNAIEAKDQYTSGHSERVASFAMSLADELGVCGAEADAVRLGALLHDVGKIGVPEAILTKPGRLTDAEFDVIKTHPARGAEILGHIQGIPDVIAAVRWHHERMAGGGYPDGLIGQDIPLAARIVSVADAFDAMTSNRAYRRDLSVAEAISEFKRCAGTQFDGDVCAAMVKLLEGGRVIPCNDLFARGIDVKGRVWLRRAG